MRRLLPLAFIVAGCTSNNVSHELPYQPPPYMPPPDMSEPPVTPPPGTVGPGETQLSKDASVRPLGVDSSHYAYWLVDGPAGGAVWTASLEYASSAHIVSSNATQVAFSNDILLTWNSAATTAGNRTSLSTFRHYGPGSTATIATNAVPGIAANYGDWIGFADGLSADGTAADIYLSKLDGSARTRVATNVNVTAACAPQLAFNYQTLVLSTCAAGSTSATVASVDMTSGTVTTVKTGVLPGIYRRGNVFLFNDATASYYTYGQTATALDKPLQLPTVAGKSVVYAVGRQLRAFDIASQPLPRDVALLPDAPVQLVSSPDGSQVAFWSHAGDAHDLSLLTTATGATRALRADYTAFAGFTDDSLYVLFIDNVDTHHNGAVVAAPVAGSAASRWLTGTVAQVQPARASKLVYTEIGADGVAALKLVDLALDSAPVTLAKGVDAAAFITDTDRSRVLYSRSKAPTQGLFFSVIP